MPEEITGSKDFGLKFKPETYLNDILLRRQHSDLEVRFQAN
jgi:hypothetical protein